MSYENKGSTTATAIVTAHPDRSGNFVIEGGDDPAVVIEAAWTYLNTFGGGTLITKGAGQTWTFLTRCDSQGDNVTWRSDWSLTFTIPNAFNGEIVRVTHDNVTLDGLHIDGNRANQGDPTGLTWDAIEFYQAANFRCLFCFVEDVVQYGITCRASTITYKGLIMGNTVEYADWNGIHCASTETSTDYRDVLIIGNHVEHFGDVGILIGSSECHSVGNTVRNGDLEEGGASGSWCYAFEQGGAGVTINSSHSDGIAEGTTDQGLVFGNNIQNCRVSNMTIIGMREDGVRFNNTATNNKVSDSVIRECNDHLVIDLGDYNEVVDCEIENLVQVTAPNDGLIELRGLNSRILNNRIYDGTSTNNISGVHIDGSTENPAVGHVIRGNKIGGFDGSPSYCVSLDSNVDDCFIVDNTFHDSFRAIQIAAATEANNTCQNNRLLNITGAQTVQDNGTGTVWNEVGCQLVQVSGGAALVDGALAAPSGIDVDTADEAAIGRLKLPEDLTYIVRVQVWAHALVAEATDNMLLRVIMNGAASGETWNTVNLDVPDIPSEETGGIAIADAIHWLILSVDTAGLRSFDRNDYVQIMAVGEGASAPDIATDALFGHVLIEYA